MEEDEFSRHKQALTDKRLEKPKKLSSRGARIWQEISTYRFNFNRDEIEVAELSSMSRQDVLAFFDSFLSAHGPHRRKFSVHVVSVVPSEQTDEEANSVVASGQEIANGNTFKSGLCLHPLAQPFVDLNTLKRVVDLP